MRHSKSSEQQARAKSSGRLVGVPIVAASSPFNALGVIEQPAFVVSRPATAGGIDITVQAHPVEGGWIAESSWGCRVGHLPFDGLMPHRGSQVFAHRSEAVGQALSLAVRRSRDQLGAARMQPAWLARIESAADWVGDTLIDLRRDDEGLPLHRRTVIDLFSGGHGGFGMAMTSLGPGGQSKCSTHGQVKLLHLAWVN